MRHASVYDAADPSVPRPRDFRSPARSHPPVDLREAAACSIARIHRADAPRSGAGCALSLVMPAASLDELRFFLDDRDDIAQRVQATGATTTQVMAAIGAHEQGGVVPDAPAAAPVREVVAILEEDEQAIEVEIDDLL